MLQEDLFKKEHIEHMWSSIAKSDNDTKQCIYKIFSDVSTNLKSHHIETILYKIAEI